MVRSTNRWPASRSATGNDAAIRTRGSHPVARSAKLCADCRGYRPIDAQQRPASGVPRRAESDGSSTAARRLRFRQPLEDQFRLATNESILPQFRAALIVGVFFVCGVVVLDYLLLPAEFVRWSIAVRIFVMLPAIAVALLVSYRADGVRWMPALGVTVGLCVGLASLATGAIASRYGIAPMFSGYLVVTFYVYFLLGLRLLPAIATASALLLGFLGLVWIVGAPNVPTLHNALFLLFANLIGATGLYSIERVRRERFLERLALAERALRDPLTGLGNRTAFEETLSLAWGQMRRDRRSIAVALVDIDHFKAYNDIYGHQAGDRCLAVVAREIAESARRPLDFAGRYGGEEFVLLLAPASDETAQTLAEELRARVAGLRVPHRGSEAYRHVTVSVGVSCLFPHEELRSMQGFVQLADEALYRAKEQGRNRTVLARDETALAKTGIFRRDRLAP